MDHDSFYLFGMLEIFGNPPPCLRHRLACGSPWGRWTSDPAGILCRNSRRAWEVTETVTFPKNCH